MTFIVQKAGVLKGATAPAGAVSVLTADSVDIAVADLQEVVGYELGMVVDYVRAKNIATLSTTFVSRAGNTITPGPAGAFVGSEATMAGKIVVDMAAMGDASGAAFPSDVVCPASFTLILPLRVTTLRAVNHLFAVTGSKFSIYLNNLGKVVVDDKYGEGEAVKIMTDIACPVNTTRLLWVSHDAPSKTTRYGITNAVKESHVHTLGHAPDAASLARFYSFYQAQSASIPIAFAEGWLLLNKAYAADASEADTAIARVLSAWSGFIGA